MRTKDRAPPGGTRTLTHTIGQIGPKRKIRPDGTLLCEDVALARTGTLLYAPGEVPLRPPTRAGARPVLEVTRDAATLFSPEAMGSAIGAAVTNDHPPVDITPHNWNQLARGFILDAWQGEGAESDIMFGDIVVSDAGLIHKINIEKIREVSLGYTADYEQTGDGAGRQRNIVVNHLALVEYGRCGPRCAIGDRKPEEEAMPRSTTGTGGPRPRVRLEEAAATLQEAIAAMGGGDEDEDGDAVHVHVHMNGEETRSRRTRDGDGPGDNGSNEHGEGHPEDPIAERMTAIEDGMLELHGMLKEALAGRTAGSGTEGSATGDSAALQSSFTQFTSQAEILVPGFKAATFDAALPRVKTVDMMCSGRRQVLTMLAATTDGAALLKQVADDDEAFNVEKADCKAIASAFKSAAAVKAASNNRAATGDGRMGVPPSGVLSPPGPRMPTGEEINTANAKFWAAQQPGLPA